MDADAFSLETIRECNPAAGIFLNEADLVAAADMGRQSDAFEPAYRNYRLNQRIRTDADARLVDAATWNRGAVPVVEEKLIGKSCVCGFDNAAKHDLVAFLLAFEDTDGILDILCRFWTPLGQLPGRRPGERELFEQCIRAGYLIGVPGHIVDPAWVLREISLLAARFKITEIRYDRSYMDGIRLEMARAGVTLPFVEHRQGFISMGLSTATPCR
jgi:phage terminase large subunit-like protein